MSPSWARASAKVSTSALQMAGTTIAIRARPMLYPRSQSRPDINAYFRLSRLLPYVLVCGTCLLACAEFASAAPRSPGHAHDRGRTAHACRAPLLRYIAFGPHTWKLAM